MRDLCKQSASSHKVRVESKDGMPCMLVYDDISSCYTSPFMIIHLEERDQTHFGQKTFNSRLEELDGLLPKHTPVYRMFPDINFSTAISLYNYIVWDPQHCKAIKHLAIVKLSALLPTQA
jgi:hypothetical protein